MLDLNELLGIPRSRRQPRFSADVAKARRREQSRRAAAAQGLARTALTKLHPDDYAALYRQAVNKVNADRGPLPGDENEGTRR